MDGYGERCTLRCTQVRKCGQSQVPNWVRTSQHIQVSVACDAAQVALRAAVMVFREKREALNALLAEAEALLRPFPEERERLARLVQGPL